MKHKGGDAINQNAKKNHTKKYQHNMNIITFLKSNYKYKRRCTIGCRGSGRRRQMQPVWRREQTHPLPVVEQKMSDHRIARKKISLCTTKVSKFPRIFILITQSTAAKTPTAPQPPPPLSTADYSGLLGSLPLPPPLVERIQRNVITNRPLAATANNAIDGIRRQRNAYKDANEDTNIDSDATNLNDAVTRCHVGDEMHYQHGNYDKVSTITSTPPLRCHIQKHHHQPQSQTQPQHQRKQTVAPAKTTATSTFPTLSSSSSLPSPAPVPVIVPSSSPDQANSDETGRCFTRTLRHRCHRNHSNHHAMHTKSSPSASAPMHDSDSYTDRDMNSNSSKSTAHARSCQSLDPYINAATNNSNNNYSTMSLLLTLFITFAIGVRTATAGACWQTVLGNGKCNEIFSFNVSKSECCGANQEFAYTDREPTNVEYFFATAIGGGMECTPCLESCRNVKCGPNKKCVKRKGRPKCVCAPECGAARRRRLQREQQQQQQYHSLLSAADREAGPATADLKTMSSERSRQSRDTHSLSSEITKANLDSGKQNQRRLIHIHMQHDYAHQQEAPPPPPQPTSPKQTRKKQQPKGNRRLLITANVEHTEKPTTRRIQLFSNVRTTYARQRTNSNNNSKGNGNGQHEDTDLSEEYEEDDYDDEDADDVSGRSRGISFNSGFSNSYSSSSNNNDHNDDDDATRFRNQSLSRHKSKTNKNNHDLQTTKTQQRDQYSNHNNNSNSLHHIRHPHPHPHQNGRHAESTPNRHRNNNNNHHHQHQHKNKHQHHNQNRHHDDRHDHQHHNNREQNSGLGRRKHNRQHHHKERTNLQKPPKNHKDYNTIITIANTTTTTISTSSSNNNKVMPPSTNKASISSRTSVATTPQTQLLLPTTPVNSTMSAAGASDQSRLTNHGSEIATSSSLPLSTPASSPSTSSSASTSSLSGLAAASTHPYVTMPAAAASTSASSSSLSHSSAFASMDNANGEGAAHPSHHHPHRDRGGKFQTIPDAAAASGTTDSYNDDNDNTISTSHSSSNSHHFDAVSFDSYFDQFDLHGFPKSQHAITITDNIRSSNPVCGTDGRTYSTECQLRKRACRTDNLHLQVAYRGHCKTSCNGVKCLEGLTCVEDQYTMPHCIACKIECPLDDYDNGNDVVDATRAVCGADGKTYKSMCEINRIICKIGRSIGVAYPGPCRGNQVSCDDINCGPNQVCLIDLLTHQPRCTPCRYKCSRKRKPSSVRFEEEKICGVNNRTYNSWCEMRKDSCSTGFYIDVKYPGLCH